MAREPVSTNAQVAAAIARMEEQIITLQRERKEDKAEMREEVGRLEQVFRDEVRGIKADLTSQLAPIKTELAPLTRLRWQGAGLLVAVMLVAGFIGHKFGEPLQHLFGSH